MIMLYSILCKVQVVQNGHFLRENPGSGRTRNLRQEPFHDFAGVCYVSWCLLKTRVVLPKKHRLRANVRICANSLTRKIHELCLVLVVPPSLPSLQATYHTFCPVWRWGGHQHTTCRVDKILARKHIFSEGAGFNTCCCRWQPAWSQLMTPP